MAGLILLWGALPGHAAELRVLVKDHHGKLIADAVVLATPSDPKAAQRAKPPPDAVDQVDKQFVPYVKPVLLGSKVRFPNSDHIRHQVYSFSPAKKFELPLYSGTDAPPVVFDGSPVYPDALGSWKIVAETRANIFGTGAASLTGVEKAGLDPAKSLDTSALRSVLSTGSPLPTSTWGWLHDVFDGRVRLDSSSGGTDVCSALVSGSPWLPVYVGELSGPCLGAKVEGANNHRLVPHRPDDLTKTSAAPAAG